MYCWLLLLVLISEILKFLENTDFFWAGKHHSIIDLTLYFQHNHVSTPRLLTSRTSCKGTVNGFWISTSTLEFVKTPVITWKLGAVLISVFKYSPIFSCSPHVHVWVKVPFLSLISFCSTLNKTTHHHLYCWYQKKTQTPWEIGFLTNHIYNRHCGRGETPNTRQKLQTRKKLLVPLHTFFIHNTYVLLEDALQRSNLNPLGKIILEIF